MKRLIILSGPQAAGKSTSINKIFHLLENIYPCFHKGKNIVPFILQEARQIVVHKYHAMGGIFLSQKEEKEIINIDFLRMDKILGELDESLLYMDECNIFTLAHAKAHGVDLIDEYLPKYIEMLKKLHAVIIFLNISPEISWERRKDSYRSRLYRFPEEQREGILEKYFQGLV